MTSSLSTFQPALAVAFKARTELLDPRHETAFRLFNGFYEGWPALTADLYGKTLVLHNYADPPAESTALVDIAAEFYLEALPWLQTALVKSRHGETDDAKRGALLSGETPDRFVLENGIWYRIDLHLNQDSSFYLDTRHLREWLKTNSAGKTVLNTFAYTGSLGVAARAGGASRVVQSDLSRPFLNIGKDSFVRNGFPVQTKDFVAADFWPQISHLKRENSRFDCVILDPPLFSRTRHGIVDLAEANARLINKVRPLVADGGTLVTINNALYVSGAAYMQMLESLCADGYLSVETLIPVPQDFLGYAQTSPALPSDPAPFNHPTKIAVLRVRRKEAE